MTVIELTSSICKKWLLEKHYAKRMPPINVAFGVMVEKRLQGVCTFAIPASRFSFSKQPYELNRLVTNDDLPKNTLSFFVGKALQMFPEPSIIVSYADENYGHHGYIYQATNWIYTGRSSAEKRVFLDGKELHRRTLYDKYGTSSIPKLKDMGFDVEVKKQLGKYRYFQTTGDKSDKRKFKKEILEKYDELPYPKGENQNYDSGEPIKQRLFY